MADFQPVLYDSGLKRMRAAQAGDKIDQQYTYGGAGGVANANDLVSNNAPNALTIGTDNKLLVSNQSITTAITNDNNFTRVIENIVDNSQTIERTIENIVQKASVSTDRDNVIQDKNGAYLSANDLVANTPNNALYVDRQTGLLMVDPQQQAQGVTVVSKDRNNIIVQGADNGAFLDPTTLIDNNTPDNQLKVNQRTGLLYVDKQAQGQVTVVSTDRNNSLTAGQDGGAYLDIGTVIDNGTANNPLKLNNRTGGLYVELPQQNNVKVVSADRNNSIIEGADGGAFLQVDDIVSQEQGNIITVDRTGKLMVTQTAAATNVDPADKILQLNVNNQLGTILNIEYENGTGLLKLLGVNQNEIGRVTLQTADAILDSASLGDGPQGNRPDEFLKLVFNKQNGQQDTVWVDLAKFIDAYKAGQGLELDQVDNIFNVKLGQGLQFDGDDKIEIHIGTGLQFDLDGSLMVTNTDTFKYDFGVL